MLQSAVGTPEMSFGGQLLHADLASMAAAYLFHLCANHPFVDGNKRTADHAAHTFLGLNDHDWTFTDDELVELTLAVASSTLD